MEKKQAPRKRGKVAIPVICVLTALVLVANLATAYFYNTITYYFQGADTTYDSAEAKSAKLDAEGVVQEIVRSGIVLLKNEPDSQGDTLLPLATSAESKTKVNLFGWDSVGWVIGGSGSGTAGNEGVVSLSDALEAGNYEVNQELIQLYKKHQDGRPETGVGQADWTITELPASQYTDAVMEQAKGFSDVAIICIGRVGGEGNDLPTDMSTHGGASEEHYLELGKEEKAMIELVCQNFGKVIVLVNSPGTMELGWVDEYDSIRSVLYVGLTGATGIMALPDILNGTANPSGRTADLYAYDLKSAPSFVNAGEAGVRNYPNTKTEGFMGVSYSTFNEYQEGIYVGYRYYETRGFTDGEEWYQANVQYPFGYGLSYTRFDREMGELKTNSDGTLSVDVTIRNVGDVAGRDVAQLYYTAPYTQGGIEKSHVVLLDFAKTATLEPAQAQTITFTFSPEDMASYDYRGAGCYVLEGGDYELKLMANSHEVIDSKTYNVPATITYGQDNKRASDFAAAVNRFDGAEGDVTFLSRADWEGTWPKRAEEKDASPEVLKAGADGTAATFVNAGDVMPTTGAKNGLTLKDMTGLAYDDPKWDQLLDQMSVEELYELVGKGGYQTAEIASIGKPHANDLDGPQGINEANQSTKKAGAASYPSEVVTGCTWDTEIAKLMGLSIGKEALAYGVNGWYGPAVNLHRTPFGGRVFEYYSEDPVLSGKLGAACTEGAMECGVYCYVKHFAANETETNRVGLFTWCNEQALRELYFKPFELAVKEGEATGIMSAFNRLNARWCGGSKELLTDVLRGEWGFQGTVVTDYFMGFGDVCYMGGYDGLYAGNDLWLAPIDGMGLTLDTSSATIVNQMRGACHNILYMSANSNLVDSSYAEKANMTVAPAAEKTSGIPLWAILFYGVFDVAYVVIVAAVIVWIVKGRKKGNTAD